MTWMYTLTMLVKQRVLVSSFLERTDVFKTLISVCQIASPTFHEQKKIRFLANQLVSLGLQDVKIDEAGNCLGRIINDPKQKKFVLISAHADTACVAPLPITVTEKNGFLFAHGICDNSAGVTGVLTFLRFLKGTGIRLKHNYLIAFTVQEEALGAKRGMKHVMKKYKKSVRYVVNVESHDIGRVTTECVGQFRAKLTLKAKQKGAHSWRNFGEPNSVVILAKAISDFSKSPVPPKSTYNFAAIKGGEGINAIPSDASCLFECRSSSQESIGVLVKRLNVSMGKYANAKVKIQLEVLATTEGASMDRRHPISVITQEVHTFLKIKSYFKSGNSDGDVPLSLGIPTITLGTGVGFATHSLEEKLEKKSFKKGIEQIMLVLLALDERC